MIDITTIFGGVALFTTIVMLLVAVILYARSKLVTTGDIQIEINGDPEKSVLVRNVSVKC